MERPVTPQPDRPGARVTSALQKAAAIFDAALRPADGAQVRLVDRSVEEFGPGEIEALARAKAQELRQLAALCSMAARRVQEMARWPQSGVPEAETLAELRAVCDFLHDRFLRASS